MIDLITLVKSKVSESEILQIVERSNLQKCTRNGKIYYETSPQQRNKEQMYIRIEVNGKMKIDVNLHKHHERSITCGYTNYGTFTMNQAQSIINKILIEKGITPDNLKVYNYEVGLNLTTSKDCREYLDRMTTIGILNDNKPLYINPRYKNERVKTTIFHRHIRKHFKVYDKCFEAKDKRRTDVPDRNILRIETVYRRVDKMSCDKFFSTVNLDKAKRTFFKDWSTLQFDREITAPKGIGVKKKELCKTIIKVGTKSALLQAREKHKNGTLTDKEFRNIREFITREWEVIKPSISFMQSIEEQEYRRLLNIEKALI